MEGVAIAALYKQHGSVWKVGELVGRSGQVVYKYLKRNGLHNPMNRFSEVDVQMLKDNYTAYAETGRVKALAEQMGRTVPFLCTQARKLGLTDPSRSASFRDVEKWVAGSKAARLANGHPRGMLGKVHSDETKEVLRMKSADRWAGMTEDEQALHTLNQMKSKLAKNGTLANERKGVTWKGGWREIGVIRKYYRSSWEANYARYLEWQRRRGLILAWEHEPETFWFEEVKRGVRSYLPDFRVVKTDGSVSFHEVKGWMDPASKTKLARMAKYHPAVKMELIDAPRYRKIKSQVSKLIPGWE